MYRSVAREDLAHPVPDEVDDDWKSSCSASAEPISLMTASSSVARSSRLGQQALRLVEQARVLEGDAHGRGDGRDEPLVAIRERVARGFARRPAPRWPPSQTEDWNAQPRLGRGRLGSRPHRPHGSTPPLARRPSQSAAASFAFSTREVGSLTCRLIGTLVKPTARVELVGEEIWSCCGSTMRDVTCPWNSNIAASRSPTSSITES